MHPKPRYKVGDILWVKQNWRTEARFDKVKPSLLPDDAKIYFEGDETPDWKRGKLRPAMFLQRRFARPARYEVTGVKCERVDAISWRDAIAEGCEYCEWAVAEIQPEESFKFLWNSIHSAPNTRFDDGPFVWCYTFRRVR